MKIAKERGVQIALVNGKISERSCRRFLKIPVFARKLFGYFDILCVQNVSYRQRFISLKVAPEKIKVTGNLKLDVFVKSVEDEEKRFFRKFLGITDTDSVLVIGSTHAPEEERLLSSLSSVFKKLPELKVLFVPRHPERFNEVAHLMQEKGLKFHRFSEGKRNPERLILIDAMGKLNQCYQIATLAIVGGSYTSRIGGHNIFEPVAAGVPVFFGPYMHNQPDLKELIITAGAGKEVTLEQLPEALIEVLQTPELHRKYVAACHHLV